MKYLLDTAPWINAVLLPQVLPERIRQLLGSDDVKALCAISLLEAAILHRIGRLQLAVPLPEFFVCGLSSDLRVLELTPRVAARTNELGPGFHGDPFDRTIAATAAEHRLTLITCDPAIRDAEVCEVVYYPFKPLRGADRRRSDFPR